MDELQNGGSGWGVHRAGTRPSASSVPDSSAASSGGTPPAEVVARILAPCARGVSGMVQGRRRIHAGPTLMNEQGVGLSYLSSAKLVRTSAQRI